MPELGDTNDPDALVPGDPAALRDTAWELRVTADGLAEAADGLTRLDTPAGWHGAAAERFRGAFETRPAAWADAADAHRRAGAAVEVYAEVLERAQRRAADAAAGWQQADALSASSRDDHARRATTGPVAPFVDPGEAAREDATALLARVRAEVRDEGDRAAAAVAPLRDRALEAPGMLSGLASGAATVAAHAGNAALSLGNAAVQNPLSTTAVVGGGLLAAAGVAVGATTATAGAIDLALQASGPDRVAPFRVDQDTEGPPSSTAAGSTAEGIRTVGKGTKSTRVRQVASEEELRAVHDRLARDGEPFERQGYDGTWVRQADGSEIGLRGGSMSGGPTIDVRLPNGEKWKVHLPR